MYDIVLLTDSRYENPKERDWYIDQVLLEDRLVQEALEQKGLKVIKKDWACPNFDWSQCSYALFRTTWDYFDRFEEFIKWFHQTKVQFINAADLILWNLDKHYLLDLEKQGINIAPTLFVEKSKTISLKELFSKTGFSKAVLKPAIAGAARETYLIAKTIAADFESTLAKLLKQEAMLFQECQDNIVRKGEISIVMIGSEYSHAVLKKAKAGDFRVQDDFGGTVEEYQPTDKEISFAIKALKACPLQPIYARVDIFYDNANQLALGELELIEPELWFRNNPKAAKHLATAIAKMISSP